MNFRILWRILGFYYSKWQWWAPGGSRRLIWARRAYACLRFGCHFCHFFATFYSFFYFLIYFLYILDNILYIILYFIYIVLYIVLEQGLELRKYWKIYIFNIYLFSPGNFRFFSGKNLKLATGRAIYCRSFKLKSLRSLI